MTHHPPSANDPGHGCSDEPKRQRSDRSAANHQPAGRRLRNPRLELSPPIRFTSTPFAWQRGDCLYLLVNEWSGWVLAELRFVPTDCHYVEIRRTSYRWPREAIGALLSRSLPAGEETSRRLAADVTSWLAAATQQVSIWPLDYDR